MSEYSVLFPQQPSDPDAINDFARLVIDHDLSRLWMGQSFSIESHMALAALARSGNTVPVGIGTALAALRTPYDAALSARSLAAVLGQPVSVGYGAADPGFVTSVRGAPLARPASYTAEYARLVGALLRGEEAVSRLDDLPLRAQLPALEHPRVEAGVGVLRPGMAAKAREVADFVVTWLTPGNYVRDVLVPRLERADGSRPRVATHVHCAVRRPGRNPQLLAQVGCGNHLAREHYSDMLRRAGLDVHASDPVSSARELVSAGVVVYGSPSEIADRLRAFPDFGVDEVIVNITAVALTYGDDDALADLHEISTELKKG
ncbi:LLM class flavin-dependent oxidoreductase [Nocardiopsis halotolerans]|uniref:LLM class flavin-dependent oxidoreductase n=1 Tax=Nocardiopsis halotolerans TaxID=124252 RepID=UPI000347B7ED|nr:LLM class flavin-dependent oxidoreductase [Nocardiopsis halotolerans]